MYRICTTEKTALQQKQAEQALRRLLQQMPYEQISVCRICQEADLSRKSFYRVFSSKEGVLCALIDHTLMEFVSFPTQPVREPELLPELVKFFQYWKHNRDLLQILSRNGQLTLLMERELLHVYADRSTVRSFFGVEDHPDAQGMLLFYLSGIMGLLMHWYRTDFEASEEHMALLLGRVLTGGSLSVFGKA